MPRERKNKYGTERGPGAGRPATKPPPDPHPVHALFVEGRARIYPDDDETFEKLGNLRAAAETFGMVVHCVPLDGRDINQVRKSWGTGRIDHDVAEAYIREYPGLTFAKWVEEIWLGGDPLNAITFAAAKAKARIGLSLMFKNGRVRKEKDARGQLVLFPGQNEKAAGDIPPNVKIDVDKYVKKMIDDAHAHNKQVATAAIAGEVANIVWRGFVESFVGKNGD